MNRSSLNKSKVSNYPHQDQEKFEYVQYSGRKENNVPIQNRKNCTDVCCIIIGVLFVLAMIIAAIVMFQQHRYLKTNFASDSQGRPCGVGQATGFPFVYFAQAPDISQRICVRQCPKADTQDMTCLMTQNLGCVFSNYQQEQYKKFNVNKYQSQQYDDKIGKYCIPKQPLIKQQLIESTGLKARKQFIQSYQIIGVSLLISASLSIIYCVFTQCFPQKMNKAAIGLGPLVLILMGIYVLYKYSHYSNYGLVATIFFVIALVLILNFLKNRKVVDMNGIFLKHASRMVTHQKKDTALFIPLFMVFLAFFIMMILLQFKGFWAGTSITFDASQSLFYSWDSIDIKIMMILLIIQAIWGFSFLKEAFNFCVSGNAVSWYYGNNASNWTLCTPFSFMLKNHLGSVIGGSFMTGFFTIADYLFDLIKPSQRMLRRQNGSCYVTLFNSCCCYCNKIFDLVRSDAMAYINITAVPYCNAARYCEYLSDQSDSTQGGQSTSRSYRLSAHMLIAGLTCLICVFFKGALIPNALLFILVSSIFICTFFVSFHADIAQAIAISYMQVQQTVKRGKGQFTKSQVFQRNSRFAGQNVNAVQHNQVDNDVDKQTEKLRNRLEKDSKCCF